MRASAAILGRRRHGGWNPLALFRANEPGGWYDPSDLSTMFQDAAGTTPVTTVEQPVGLHLDKSKGLALGAAETLGAWTASNTGTGSATISGEQVTIVGTDGSNRGRAYRSFDAIGGKWYRVDYTAVINSGGCAIVADSTPLSGGWAQFNPTSGTNVFYFRAPVTATGTVGAFTSSGGGNVTLTIHSVKEIAGNHRYQGTSAARPTLSARYNLAIKTDALSDASWIDGAIGGGTRSNGTVSASNTEGIAYIRQNGTYSTAAIHTISFDVTCDQTVANVPIRAAGSTSVSTLVNFTAGVSQRVTLTGFGPASSYFEFGVDLRDAIVPGGSNSFGYNLTFNNIDLRATNDGVGLPAYQRVNTSTDYDTAGFPMYLKYDGTDDFMQTAAVDFSATDKVSLFGGYRKADDTARIIYEFSTTISTNAGSFYLVSGNDAGFNGYSSQSRGNATASTSLCSGIGTFSGADTAVLTATHDISGDLSTFRRNGVAGTNSVVDKGAGNFGNYAIFFGARNGGSPLFNGREYQTIIRGAASTATEIAAAELYVNNRTRAY